MGAELQLLDVFIGVASATRGNPGGFGAHAAVCFLHSEEGDATLSPETSSHSTLAGFATKAVAEFLKAIATGLGKDNNAVTTIYCNTLYVVDAVNKWLPNWKKNGWMTKNGTPVKQRETWEQIETCLAQVHGQIVYCDAPAYARSEEEMRMVSVVNEALALMPGAGDPAAVKASSNSYTPKPAPKPKEPEPVLAGQGLW